MFQQIRSLPVSLFALLVMSLGLNAAQPVLNDERLDLTLFASDPDIRTPIGLAIDERDRIHVLESHTHSPPDDYEGPDSDRILVFEDSDYDGKPDRSWQFADGIEAGMNLAFGPKGNLYVCAAREVLMFSDSDGDGKSDERKQILRVETDNTYPHSCQMGIAITPDGWIYISRGNNGGVAYTVHGTDGTTVSGFGDGGNVYRCRLDGSELEEVATGFWNSMDLKFDSHGRLMLVDNDPDARGPNRLVHVVEQGDYGYKSVFGGGGNHPYQGWDGTLPGTLPFVDGTGEAPSGLIDTDRTALPADHRDQYLVTVWNENSIARYFPEEKGATRTATHEVWMQGGQDFRPVALEADSRGNLFITDWVLVAYPNHGRGAIWRVSAKPEVERLEPIGYFDRPDRDSGAADFASLITASKASDFKRLERALRGGDPFLAHAAVVALSRPVFHERLRESADDSNPAVRLGVLLAMRRGAMPDAESFIREFLKDPDEQVRRMALMWIGEEGLLDLKPDIEKAIAFDDLSATLFETYLATHEVLTPEFVNGLKSRNGRAGRIPRELDPEVVRSVLRDEDRSDRVRALALIHLEDIDDESNFEYLKRLARNGSPLLQREALRSLSQESLQSNAPLFIELSLDGNLPADVRAEALLALSREAIDEPERLLPLLDDTDEAVRIEAARTLRIHAWREPVRPVFEVKYRELKQAGKTGPLLEQIEYALHPPGTEAERAMPRPDTAEQWHSELASGGDPIAGERVYFSLQTQCASCHLMHNRGRRIGPELSNIGQSLNRRQIIQSILKPSEQFAPQYQAWYVELEDEFYQGLQLDHKSGGDIELYTTEGRTRHFESEDIVGYGAMPNSLMPDGLEQTMTVHEMRDLMAYLESLK